MQAVKKFLLIWIAAFSALSSRGYALEESLSLLFTMAVGKTLMTARQPPVKVTFTKAVYLEEGHVFRLSGQLIFPEFDPEASSVVIAIQQGAERQREITETVRQNRRLWLLRSCGEHMDGIADEYAGEENETTEWWMLEEVLYGSDVTDGSYEVRIRYEDLVHEGMPLNPDTSYCITPPLHNKTRISNDAPCDGESDNKDGKNQTTRQESSDSKDDTSSDGKNDSTSKEAVCSVTDPDCIITNVEPYFEVAPEIAAYCDALEWAQIKQEPESDDEMPIDSEVVTVEAHSTIDGLVSPPPAKKRKLSGHLKTDIETVHESKKKYVCDWTEANDQPCNQTFARKNNLKRHRETVHESKKKHVCDWTEANDQPCNRAFARKNNLKRHREAVHEGKKKHICDWTEANGQPCNRTFARKNHLKRHRETVHEGKREHACDWIGADGQPCNQAFGRKYYLKTHMEIVHNGKKEHVCNWIGAYGQPCNKAFGLKDYLKRHMETVHEGKKEHICDRTGENGQPCNKAFGYKSHLKTHIKTVHESKKEHVCDKTGADGQPCNQGFGQKNDLNRHIEAIHEGKKRGRKRSRIKEADDQAADSQQH